MLSDRREFIERATRVATGLGTVGVPLAAQNASRRFPTSRAGALMTVFGLRYPIFCAGFGFAANPELAIAVSNGGGLGALGTGLGSSADAVRQLVTRTKSGTSGPFAVNYLLAVEPVTLPIALDAGAPVIQFAWGIPTADAVAMIRKAGAKMGVQVSSASGARRALDAGADYLICQGTEAGGHVQASKALYEELPAVVEEAKAVPVLAAGGIANGAHIRRALLAGASGVLIGTRFLATKEAGARRVQEHHHQVKSRRHSADRLLSGRVGQRAASRTQEPDP